MASVMRSAESVSSGLAFTEEMVWIMPPSTIATSVFGASSMEMGGKSFSKPETSALATKELEERYKKKQSKKEKLCFPRFDAKQKKKTK